MKIELNKGNTYEVLFYGDAYTRAIKHSAKFVGVACAISLDKNNPDWTDRILVFGLEGKKKYCSARPEAFINFSDTDSIEIKLVGIRWAKTIESLFHNKPTMKYVLESDYESYFNKEA